jgi:hypothetical protein
MVSFLLWKDTITKINNYQKKKIPKDISASKQDSFLEKFQGKGSRERITNNQVVFFFSITKRNEMKMRCNFSFSFMNIGKKVKRKKENNQ